MANEAAWVKQARSSIEVEPLDMWSPGPGELLVANKSISFNPIEARIQKSSPYPPTLQSADIIDSDFDED
jgi:NADPH:quinone reductase-like Zn-dependent oxidoreductase